MKEASMKGSNMTQRNLFRAIALLLTASLFVLLAACSSSNNNTTPPPSITISLSTTPSPAPTSLAPGSTLQVTATVANDSANGGVTWSCTPANTCGTFNPTSSASGAAVTYTAPSSPPASAVIITATSVTDTSVSQSLAGITITPAGLAAGNYVFSLAGSDLNSSNNFSYYFYTGAFAVDSTGAISGGEQSFTDTNHLVFAEPISGGSVAASSDGNLTITLTFADTYIGNNAGQVTFDASAVSGSKALLIEYDSWASASGELDAQTATPAAPSGGYAFYERGYDVSQPGLAPYAIGGIINVDGSGTISGSGSVLDVNDVGTLSSDQPLTANDSTVSSPDTFGHVTFDLNTTCCGWPTNSTASLLIDGYIIDANHIRLIENWQNDDASGLVGGTALGQGSNTGTFATASASGSTYVIGTNGDDAPSGALQVAGVLAFPSSGTTMGGNLSYNDITVQNAQGGEAITAGSYTVDSTGRVTVTGVTDTTADFSFNFQLYLTGDGHAVAISMDSGDVLAGLGWAQTSSPLNAASLTGGYALGLMQVVGGNEQDAVGAFTADGVSNITGFLDYNEAVSVIPPTLVPDQSIGGTYATTSTNGVFTVSAMGGSNLFTSYLIDGTQGVIIENDATALSLGYFAQQ